MLRDLAFAVRQLARRPGFSLAMAATLMLGIGATTAIFSLIDAVLLKPLPYPDAGRLVRVWGHTKEPDVPQQTLSEPEVLDLKAVRGLEALAAYVPVESNLTGGDQPERVNVNYTTGDFFRLLGAKPLLGRTFTPQDESAEGQSLVILSHGIWQRRFGGDPKIVGKTIHVNLAPRTVIGVMPADYDYPEDTDIWGLYWINPANVDSRQEHYLNVVARLKPGVTLEQVNSELASLSTRVFQENTIQYAVGGGWGMHAISMLEQEVGDVRPTLFTLFGAVAFVLLIACANVGSMLLVRVQASSREILVRSALGAGRGSLVRQFACESLVLALLGCGLGLAAAWWTVRTVLRNYAGAFPRAGEVGLDARVFAFAVAVSLLTAVVVSLLPAFKAARPDLASALREVGGSASAGGSRARGQKAIVVAEVALAITLLVGAGLMIRSFLSLQHQEVGFRPEQTLSMQLALPRTRYAEDPQVAAFWDELARRVAAVPGVAAGGVVSHLPLSGSNFTGTITVEGRTTTPGTPQPEPALRSVTAGYFEALRIPLKRGRLFAAQDDSQAPLVAVVDERLAKNLWPDQDPIGRRLRLGPPDAPEGMFPWRSVVGVVGAVRHDGPIETPSSEGELYFPMAQAPQRSAFLAVRATAGDPAALAGTLQQQIRGIDPDEPAADIQTMEQRLSDDLARPRLAALLLSLFGGLALVLAAIGVYAVIAQMAAQRTGEIGIRMALGADRGSVLRLMADHGLRLIGLGVAIGVPLAFALVRLASRLLYGVGANDPLTFVAVVVLLAVVAALAVLIPARRAARLNPMVALRTE